MDDKGNIGATTSTRHGVRALRPVSLVWLLIMCVAAAVLFQVYGSMSRLQTGEQSAWPQLAVMRTVANKAVQHAKHKASAIVGSHVATTVATSTVPSTSTPAPAASIHGAWVGLSVGNTFPWLPEATLAAYLDDIQVLGVGWLRVDFAWDGVERIDGGAYDWSHLDRLVAAAQVRGIHILPILLAPPVWERDSSCTQTQLCAPAHPEEFARFASAAAHRYAPQGIHHWEIWNEPNMGRYWGMQGNVAGYVALLNVVSAAIKAEDPSAVIITGGLGPAATDGQNISTLDFVEGLYAAGAASSFDAIGIHPYTFPTPVSYEEDWNAWMHMGTTKRSVRSIMIAHGDAGKTIWLTEYGAPTGGPGTRATVGNYGGAVQPDHVSEELQALILSDALAAHAVQEWAGPLFWYAYKDLGTSGVTNENFFGLIRHDGTRKPAYATLKTAIAGPQ